METSDAPSPGACQVTRLTQALVAGDEAAFREFHAEYFSRLYRFLLVTTRGQEQEAQEALQQTFLRVVRYIRVFDSEEVFWGWLKAVARSVAHDGNRKQRRYGALLQRFALGSHSFASAGAADEESQLSVALDEVLAQLPAEERHLLEGKYLQGFTTKELASQARISDRAVESRLERLRRIVRERVLKKLARP